MTTSKSKLFLDTLELRKGSVINRDEVNALKRRWSPRSYSKCDRYAEYEAFMQCGPYQVDAKATAAGLSWWRNMTFTPKGEVRATKFMADYCAHYDVTLPRILRTFSHFMLVDWEFEMRSPLMGEWMFPTYGMYSVDGARLLFVARPWQAGGNYIL